MKKITSSLVVLLLIAGSGFSSYGRSVDQSTALTAGSNFLISAGVQGVSSAADLSLAYTATSVVNGNTINNYYVFTVNGGHGFVMVSGDDIIIPILAYSDKSSFDINHMAPATKDWIDGYKNQITAAITHNLPAKAGTAQRWSDLQSVAAAGSHAANRTTATGVTPLVTTTWDQAGGGSVQYDQYCPNTTDAGGLSVTGCVATAMAQVMKFWNWPTVGCGSHTYFDPYIPASGGNAAAGSNSTNTADFGNTAYQWSSMPLTSSNAAVATLMYHAGVSVNMSYSANESGSYVGMEETQGVNCAEYALKTYFHYKPTLKSVLRFGQPGSSLGTYYYGSGYTYYQGGYSVIDSVAQATWITMLQTELSAGHPMLYEGTGTDGGHCWVCDGWETTSNMFHFNWGWSGSSDAYYTVESLSPPALGIGAGAGNFNYDQGVIMGIQPDSFPSNAGNIELLAHLNTTTSSPMKYGSPLSITTKIKNAGTTTFTGSFCALVYDTSNTVVDTIAKLTGESVTAGDSTAVLTFASAGLYGAIPVSYHSIRVLYQAAGGTTWTPVANNGSFINYTIIDVQNDTDIILADSMHIGSHTILPGGSITMSTTLLNYGNNNFSGTLQAIMVNANTGVIADTIQQHTSQHMNSGYELSPSFTRSGLTLPAGVYALEIRHQYGGTGSFYTTSSDYYPNPVLITIKDTATHTTTGVTNVASANDVFVYPNPANNVINVLMQGENATAIRVMDAQGRIVTSLTPGNRTAVVIPVSDLAAGIYFVQVETASGITTKKVMVTK